MTPNRSDGRDRQVRGAGSGLRLEDRPDHAGQSAADYATGPPSDPVFLTPEEVRDELRLGLSTVYRALEEGRLPGEKICGRWRTLRSDLEDLVRGPTSTPRSRAEVDPMPSSRRRRQGGSFRSKVVDIDEARRGAA